MKMATECLKVLVEVLIDNSSLADAPVNILIDGKLHDVIDFYYDDKICEYVMELTEGYEYGGD